MSLTNRQQRILWATIRHYIATAEPVGSKALASEYDLSVSPATIRACMGALEKGGLLYQPHTSAGRIPSDSGYRIYVDQLINPSETLERQIENLLSDNLNWEESSLEAILRDAAQMLATISGYIALITIPKTQTTRLRHLQLVQIEPKRVMLVVLTNSYETKSVLMKLPNSADDEAVEESIVERELQILSNFLNSKLRGRSLHEIAILDWSELDREFAQYADFLSSLLSELNQRLKAPASTPIMIRGVSEVLRQPEFSQLQQVQMLMHLLEEEQEQLSSVIFDLPDLQEFQPRVSVRIGSENPLEPMRICTLVSANYQQDLEPVGSVAILGPTRMIYENAIALVAASANYLTEALSQPA
ncbi:MAG: heat-inducible transcriptional repressor HrcA [Symploca sp. SIO3C6]|uniref:Heat-inducible transcription repressor HrcA n=1 Tax=Symploca sp. SIO1C4 TaxID=2607765 RepID=A0A6B3N4X4_9CYAN|nr:heat-inducible transcriptional repressor HrcA [Symploca sp. SIO3C6]NER26573.1 heat-inducible transcriptional repressor HrcA [Symploca sp. SIO1C4]NET07418.1 heat-inducible transcriptional repressor HrcA [Symploca sp. SIO2B6]NET48310.1 heat-inducible transcriptional repressor HrcA [Merismopedia sp. SIO2A8]